MRKNYLLVALLLIAGWGFGANFLLDGYFDDWAGCRSTCSDARNDADGTDFVGMSVRNDGEWLYIKLDLAQPIVLNENNNIYLEIDTDNDPLTGYRVSGIGAEIGWNFGARYGYYNLSQKAKTLNYKNILYSLPTYASREFEIAIGRKSLPDGVNPLFKNDTIKILFWDRRNGGDLMPDGGITFTYVFTHDSISPYHPVEVARDTEASLRIMTYNTFVNGITSADRIPAFERIFRALSPDVITLNECWQVSADEARSALNTWLPCPDKNGWYTSKTDEGNITCSRFPIAESINIMKGHRLSASLINLDASPTGELLVINCHFTCCQADDLRQKEADAVVAFLRDVQNGKGPLKIKKGTPFYLSGDLNLVGSAGQLMTLLSGDIEDNKTFGDNYLPDEGTGELTDLISPIADRPMAYTWRDPEKTFSPSRLDYIIYPKSMIKVIKAFTLQTEIMPECRLTPLKLYTNDTQIASDHLPRVADITFQ